MKFSYYLTSAALIVAPLIFTACEEDPAPTPIGMHVQALAYTADSKEFEGTTASITVEADGAVVHTGLLTDGFNDLDILPENGTTYHVTIEKEGYITFEQDFTAEELAGPLQVRLFLTLNDGLKLWLPFNNNAEDASGNGVNGTLVGSPTATADLNGVANSAYQFSGTNYISVPAATLKLNVYSYSIWVNAGTTPAIGTTQNIFSLGDQVSSKHQAIAVSNKYGTVESTGWGTGGWNNGAVQNSSVATDNLPLLNQWYHIVMLRSQGAVTMYLNNQYIGTSSTGNFAPIYESQVVANIGIRCNFTQGFTGKVDELRIYDHVLTEEEIGNLFYREAVNN